MLCVSAHVFVHRGKEGFNEDKGVCCLSGIIKIEGQVFGNTPGVRIIPLNSSGDKKDFELAKEYGVEHQYLPEEKPGHDVRTENMK